MNDIINSYEPKKLQPRDACLWREWKELDDLCAKRKAESANPREPSISYIIRRRNAMGLPTEYEIWYRVWSIVGVEDTPPPRKPLFGNLHKMSIVLPNNYPAADGNPIFTFRTDVWHPNIRYSGNFKGHVCLTIKEMGVMASLKTLVIRVERYLKYQLFHAENIYPYPEDQYVAEWVREEALPNRWTEFSQTNPVAADPTTPQPTPSAEPTKPSEPPTHKIRSI